MLKLVTPPAEEPVSLVQAKHHLRVEFEDDDDLIQGLIQAARELFEVWFARSFVTTAWRLALDGFPWRWCPGLHHRLPDRPWPGTLEPIMIPRADLIAVSSITYVDTAGDIQTLDPSLYQVEAGAPGRIVPAYGLTWPSTRTQPGAVTIDFTAGYGDAAAVNARVKAAIKLMIAHLYENREATVTSSIGLREAPLGVQSLLAGEDWGYRG